MSTVGYIVCTARFITWVRTGYELLRPSASTPPVTSLLMDLVLSLTSDDHFFSPLVVTPWIHQRRHTPHPSYYLCDGYAKTKMIHQRRHCASQILCNGYATRAQQVSSARGGEKVRGHESPSLTRHKTILVTYISSREGNALHTPYR